VASAASRPGRLSYLPAQRELDPSCKGARQARRRLRNPLLKQTVGCADSSRCLLLVSGLGTTGVLHNPGRFASPLELMASVPSRKGMTASTLSGGRLAAAAAGQSFAASHCPSSNGCATTATGARVITFAPFSELDYCPPVSDL
jgi:hypothetical protein